MSRRHKKGIEAATCIQVDMIYSANDYQLALGYSYTTHWLLAKLPSL
jgi:hypothetical protein